MLNTLRKRIEKDEDGFTLIELMVVVLIIAILIAIAIPTFLGARERAQDRAAQSDLRNAFTAQKVHYTDDQVYTEDATILDGIEPSLTYFAANTATAVDSAGVYVAVDAGGAVIVGTASDSGTCFYLRDDPATGTTYSSDTTCTMPDPAAALASTEW